jgi:hypothetical protein
MTSSNVSNYGNPTGIGVLVQKGTTLKEMEANTNFDKWLSLGISISASFGYHLVNVKLDKFPVSGLEKQRKNWGKI